MPTGPGEPPGVRRAKPGRPRASKTLNHGEYVGGVIVDDGVRREAAVVPGEAAVHDVGAQAGHRGASRLRLDGDAVEAVLQDIRPAPARAEGAVDPLAPPVRRALAPQD